jgi:SAM-dependent methyltransferase
MCINNILKKNIKDNFIEIPFSLNNLDGYYIRTSILKAIKSQVSTFRGEFLDMGCGQMPYKKFILANCDISKYEGLDLENAIEYKSFVKPDYRWNGITMPFCDNEFDVVFSTEVLEHCHDLNIVLNEIYRVLKRDGVFFFTIPFLWPLHEVPNDEYRITPFAMEKLLMKSGFTEISIKSLGGWHASMAQMLGLWVRRSTISKCKKLILSLLLKPIIKLLISKDFPNNRFCESQMITGLYGTAYKK